MKRCPGYEPDSAKPMFDDDDYNRVVDMGTASQYHLVAAHPHAFCGCGTDADDCHPGRCCQDSEWGQCTECGQPEPEPPEVVVPESELSDGLFEVPC